jgi:type II secretory pathway pseudopilin PulG
MLIRLNSKSQAFTLLEVLVVIGLLLTVTLVILPITVRQLQSAKADAIGREIATEIFLAQQRAYAGENNNSYGIALASGRYTYYQGASLATAVDTFKVDLAQNITISSISLNGGGSEIFFSKNQLRSNNYGSFHVNDGTQSVIVSINKEGLISVQ